MENKLDEDLRQYFSEVTVSPPILTEDILVELIVKRDNKRQIVLSVLSYYLWAIAIFSFFLVYGQPALSKLLHIVANSFASILFPVFLCSVGTTILGIIFLIVAFLKDKQFMDFGGHIE